MSVFYEGDGWQVTSNLVRTPKKSFALERIEAVSLRRSFFLLTLIPAIGALVVTALWWRYLYPSEIWTLVLSSAASLFIAFQFGSLKVDALSLKDEEGGTVYGRFNQLSQVRDAIERAMHERREMVR